MTSTRKPTALGDWSVAAQSRIQEPALHAKWALFTFLTVRSSLRATAWIPTNKRRINIITPSLHPLTTTHRLAPERYTLALTTTFLPPLPRTAARSSRSTGTTPPTPLTRMDERILITPGAGLRRTKIALIGEILTLHPAHPTRVMPRGKRIPPCSTHARSKLNRSAQPSLLKVSTARPRLRQRDSLPQKREIHFPTAARIRASARRVRTRLMDIPSLVMAINGARRTGAGRSIPLLLYLLERSNRHRHRDTTNLTRTRNRCSHQTHPSPHNRHSSTSKTITSPRRFDQSAFSQAFLLGTHRRA